MKLKVTINNEITIDGALPGPVMDKLYKSLTMDNPEYIQAEKYGRYTKGIDKKLKFIEMSCGRVKIPRGFMDQLLRILKSHGVDYLIQDDIE